MSLKKGNELLRAGRYTEALDEYAKISQDHFLYNYAKFNIDYIKKFLIHQNENNVISLAQKNVTDVEVKNEPLISIVMPVFNVAPYLDACLISVRAQTYKNFELIIINDASTDNAEEIIKMHADLDDRIKYISLDYNTLGGAGIPSNIGIELAKGKYIGFVDSDDWVDVNAFSSLVYYAEKNNADIVIGDFHTFDDAERRISKAYDKEFWQAIPLNQSINLEKYPQLLKFSPVPWRKLYKSEFIKQNNIRYPEGDFFFEDNPLHWEVLIKAKNIVVTDALISFHRMAREGQTMSSGAFRFSALFDHMNIIRINNPKTSFNLNELRGFIYKSRWIINRQKDEAVANLFKKRLAQEYVKCKGGTIDAKEAKAISSFNNALVDYQLTIMVYAESENEDLDRTLKSIDKLDSGLVNSLVVLKDFNDDRLSVLNQSSKNRIYFGFNRIFGRAVNSLQPLCSGEYVLTVKAGEIINTKVISDLLLHLKSEKVDIVILPGFVDYRNIVVNRGFMHFCNVFFGPTEYSEISFYWLSVIYAKKILFKSDKFITIDPYIQSEVDVDKLFTELDNLIKRIKLSEINRKNLNNFSNSLAKKITTIEKKISSKELTKFKALELNFVNSLQKLGVIK